MLIVSDLCCILSLKLKFNCQFFSNFSVEITFTVHIINLKLILNKSKLIMEC